MNNKRFILNADNFGMSKPHNRAVLNGCLGGFLTSASLCANGKAFNAAVNEIIPELPQLKIGVHLNLTSGKALTKAPLLTNKKGKFNKNFFGLLLTPKTKTFLEQIEFEFRTQIETIMTYTDVHHITSNEHIHAIPEIFEIVAKLAKEYKIAYVRTHYEELYFTQALSKHLNIKYPINLLKFILLNCFTNKNKEVIKAFGLHTNDYILGIQYEKFMDSKALENGLKVLDDANILVEAFIQPCYYTTKNKNSEEFKITQNKNLEDKIKRLGFELTNCKKECDTKNNKNSQL